MWQSLFPSNIMSSCLHTIALAPYLSCCLGTWASLFTTTRIVQWPAIEEQHQQVAPNSHLFPWKSGFSPIFNDLGVHIEIAMRVVDLCAITTINLDPTD
ncbi:hypothetical protein F5Y16DRAFT_245222 [Xylariaceae sp. FL0255]|nr:hypothetical protein F5Y16DRAFT_245222 [Xylariaceae sp. FL0255]